jgi:hypothetical protein
MNLYEAVLVSFLHLILEILVLMMHITRYLLDSMVLPIIVITMILISPFVVLLCNCIEALLFNKTDTRPTTPIFWSFKPQLPNDLEAQVHLPLHQDTDSVSETTMDIKSSSDLVQDTMRSTSTQQSPIQGTTTSLLIPPDVYDIIWMCISFNLSRGRGRFDHIVVVNRDIGNVCVKCCLLVVMIPKGFVEGRIVRWLLVQRAKPLQRSVLGWRGGGLEGTADGEVEMEVEGLAETEIQIKSQIKT